MTIFSTLSSSSQASRPVYIPGKISDESYIQVFDTTLRDGEQAPGATMTIDAKVEIAYHLAKLKVDVIEAGFPASSKDDFEAVKRIALEVGNIDDHADGYVPVICVISRMTHADIDKAWEAVRHAKKPRMNVFISTSEIHMKYQLNKNKDEVLEIVREMVSYTRSLGATDIQFSSEDCSRSEKEFLYKVFGEAIKAGATTIGLGDTVGCQLPEEWGQFVSDMIANVPGIENAIISTHCHNDLGLATANTLAALSSGARQAEVTINGIGERAGNASLEEVVMAIKCRGMDQLGGLYTGINTKEIVSGSKMVEKYSGLNVQPHKPIVGANAFAHASGIHQDGMLKFRGTYEIISPDDIGLIQSSEMGIVLGRLSGRRALQSKLLKMGIVLDDMALEKVFWSFKDLAAKKKNFSEDDLHDLVRSRIPETTINCDQI